jgi:hypothetical protein
MTKEEILKRNEAIAVFMGGKLSKPRNAMNAPDWKFASKTTWAGNPEKIYTLYYDKLWDWLMPVVQKMMDKGCWTYEIEHAITQVNINALFEAVSNLCLDAQSYTDTNQVK